MKSKIGTVFFIIGAVYLISIVVLLIIRGSYDILSVFGGLFKSSVFVAAGLLMKLLSDKSNFMNSQKGYVRSWLLISILSAYLISIATIFIFLCFYTSQPINMRFMIGFAYYFLGAIITSSLIYCKFRSQRKDNPDSNNKKLVVVIDSVIKFLTLIFSVFFVIVGLFLTWKCIYAEPPYESTPVLGALFFLGSVSIVGIMTYKAKNS
jgi:FlaA1/EpsC-like NDP-sugar epimerase